MSVTGFNQRRRELLAAQRVAEEATRLEAAQQEQQAAEVEAPHEAIEEIQETAKSLEGMPYRELRAIAKEQGIEDYYKMNTEKLRAALKEGV